MKLEKLRVKQQGSMEINYNRKIKMNLTIKFASLP